MKLQHAYEVMGICSCYFLVPEGKGFLEYLKLRDRKIYGQLLDEFLTGIENYEDRALVVEGFRSAVASLVDDFCKEAGRSRALMEVQAIQMQRKTKEPLILETDIFKSKDGGMLRPVESIDQEISETFYPNKKQRGYVYAQ